MVETEKVRRRYATIKAYVGSLLLTFAIILPVAFIHHVIILGDFKVSMLSAPIVAACIIGALVGTIQTLRLRLKEQSQIFRMLADSSREFSCVRNFADEYIYISPSVETITGYSADEFAQLPGGMDAIIHSDETSVWKKHTVSIEDSIPHAPIELRIVRKDGEERWISHFCQKIYDVNDEELGIQSSNIDITDRKHYEEQILHLAEYDPLTGLPNRHFLTQHLQKLIAESDQQKSSIAVIFMDLCRFKLVNDAHGHGFGDKLLSKVANHVGQICCAEKQMLLGRFGGDEFFIVVNNFKTRDELEKIADVLAVELDHFFEIEGVRINTGASIGVAIAGRDGNTPEEIIKNAGTAMYRSKKSGFKYKFFSGDMAKHAAELFNFESRLRDAVDNDEIVLHYQPQICIKSGQLIGAEALARWTDKSGNVISPLDFITVAEDTGLIVQLGKNLLIRAISQAEDWQRQELNITQAINVSAKQFASHGFVKEVVALIGSSEVPADRFEIELTESVLLDDPDAARDKLQHLRDAGIAIALDDFGTGYSSLSYLPGLPIDIIKIDQSFVFGLLDDRRHEVICETISHLAHNLELKVVAEGIETEAQLNKIKEIGCDIGQGYLFSKPLPPEQFSQLLSSSNLA